LNELINVVFFHRKPYPTGHYSIEYLFADVRRRLADKIDARVVESTFYSRGVWKRLCIIAEAFLKRGQVNFITGDIHYISVMLPKNRTILTILDCGFIYQKSGIRRWLEELFWVTIPVRRVAYVNTISPSSKDDILKITSCDPKKIIVIPVAIDVLYTYSPKEFNKKEPVLLQVGQAENKNLMRIIEAVKDLPVRLCIIGKLSDANTRLLANCSVRYTNHCNISNEEMLQKYIDADMLVFPSTYEGFGMPILEAQAVGRPVITSNVTSMPWVAGDAACLVDPLSVASIRAGILKVIDDEEYRNELIARGLENVRRFDPDVIAGQYYELFKRVAAVR